MFRFCVTSPSDKQMTKHQQSKSKKGKRRSKGQLRGLSGVTVNPSIFPPMFRGQCLYSDTFALAPAAGGVATQVYRANSVFDPNYTGVGTTVLGYTQLAALYGRYRVLKATITLDMINNTTTTPITVFAVLSNANALSVDVTKIMGSRFVWVRDLPVISGAAATHHRLTVPIHSIYGVPAIQVRNEDDFASVVGANPNNQVFCHVGCISDSGVAGGVDVKIRIVYDVVWSLPVELSY